MTNEEYQQLLSTAAHQCGFSYWEPNWKFSKKRTYFFKNIEKSCFVAQIIFYETEEVGFSIAVRDMQWESHKRSIITELKDSISNLKESVEDANIHIDGNYIEDVFAFLTTKIKEAIDEGIRTPTS